MQSPDIVPPGLRRCPKCKCVIEILEGGAMGLGSTYCPRCRACFCAYCGAGPWDSSAPCYKHAADEKHPFGGPPDMRKFIWEQQDVSDAELEEFYTKYPHLKQTQL